MFMVERVAKRVDVMKGDRDEATYKMAVCRSVCTFGSLFLTTSTDRGAGSSKNELYFFEIETGRNEKTETEKFICEGAMVQ